MMLIGLGCDPPPPLERLVGQGEVKQLIVHDRRVVIDHGPIPTLFPAKTSSFALRGPALLQQCTPGERVRFTLERGEQTLYLVKIEKLDSTE
jgi:Cu/Ag efflux protein CusF